MNWVPGEKNQYGPKIRWQVCKGDLMVYTCRMRHNVAQGKTKSCINAVAMTVASNSDDP